MAFKGAFNNKYVKMGLGLGIFFVFLNTLAGMSIMAGSASITLFAIVSGVSDWAGIIALGIAIGIASSAGGGK